MKLKRLTLWLFLGVTVFLIIGFLFFRGFLTVYFYTQGKNFLERGEFESSRKSFHRTLFFNHSYLPAIEELSLLYQILGDTDKANFYATKAVELGTANSTIWLQRISRLTDIGKREDLRTRLEEVLNKDPQNAELHFVLGLFFLADKQFEEARYHFEEALRLDRKNTLRYRMAIADSFLREDRPKEAIEELEKIDSQLLDRAARSDFYILLALASGRAGQYDRALQLSLLAQELDPESPSVYDVLAFIYLQLGEKEKAITALEKFLELTAKEPIVPQSVIEKARRNLTELKAKQ